MSTPTESRGFVFCNSYTTRKSDARILHGLFHVHQLTNLTGKVHFCTVVLVLWLKYQGSSPTTVQQGVSSFILLPVNSLLFCECRAVGGDWGHRAESSKWREKKRRPPTWWSLTLLNQWTTRKRWMMRRRLFIKLSSLKPFILRTNVFFLSNSISHVSSGGFTLF